MFTNSIQFTANRLQERLVSIAKSPKTKARDVTLAIRTWFELEFAKREWRGMPRLKPTEFERRLKRAGVRFAAPIELTATSTPSNDKDDATAKPGTKEPPRRFGKGISLKPKTVPTPPDPTASSAVV